MKVSVTDAKGQLTELVRRAEAGDEIILTRHGRPTVPVKAAPDRPDRTARRALHGGRASVGRRQGDGRAKRRAQPGLALRR